MKIKQLELNIYEALGEGVITIKTNSCEDANKLFAQIISLISDPKPHETNTIGELDLQLKLPTNTEL